ncbi:hypothetical protein BVX98_01295 [bacterium F11]|nr:hypothetical protein BVX98_01295 [bacterium F11]
MEETPMKKTTKQPNYVTEAVFLKTVEKLPTKDDLKGFATKDDLKNFATKDDLKNTSTRLALAIQKNSADIAEIKETMATKDDVRIILNRIDHFTKKVDVFDKKVLVHDYRLNELESKVGYHDKRLTFLETK